MFFIVTKRDYTHVFISLKITISKMFKKYLLDYSFIINCHYLLTVDELHFVDEWDKSFYPIYIKIEKG